MINGGRVVDVWRKCVVLDATGRVSAQTQGNNFLWSFAADTVRYATALAYSQKQL